MERASKVWTDGTYKTSVINSDYIAVGFEWHVSSSLTFSLNFHELSHHRKCITLTGFGEAYFCQLKMSAVLL